MRKFWDVVLGDIAPVVGWVIAGIVVLLLLVWIMAGVLELGPWFTRDAYRAIRYERRGVCGICKKPYVRYQSAPADQTYGPDILTQGVCPNGHVSIVAGNRRPADWAGF